MSETEEQKRKRLDRLKKWRSTPSGKASVKKYRDKTKEQRAKWAKEYYKKNKARINKQSSEYRRQHPEVSKRTQDKNRHKNIIRGRNDRKQLKPHYVKALIRASPKQKTEHQVKIGVVSNRIKNKIKETSDEKICNTCVKPLPKSNFRQHGKKKDGSPIYSAHCNKCYSKIRKKYKINKEKQKATNMRYYWRNHAKIRERQKKYNESKRSGKIGKKG